MKYLIFILSLFYVSSVQAQDFYYYKNEKINLNKIDKQFYVELVQNTSDRFIENNINSKAFESVNALGIGFTIQTPQSKRDLIENPSVSIANPIYINSTNQRFSFKNEIIIKLKEDTQLDRLESKLKKTAWTICAQYEHGYNTYIICDESGKGEDILVLANELFESGHYEFAEPNFVVENPELYVPNDPQLELQYSVDNDGSAYGGDSGVFGSDMNVLDAWDYTTGCSDIVIAIIDNGVNLNHPDLSPNLIAGFDALGQRTAGAATDGDNHGTPCAGTAAARGDNSIGVAGIAYSCSIMPVRAFASEVSTSSIRFASAIDWAWMNGADVLSNSWSWSSSSVISDAIERAVTQGRNGLGCVVLASSGNSNLSTTLGFPARDPNVIAVGASNMCNERKSGAIDTTGCFDVVVTNLAPDITGGVSCDNDRCWGSNYGNDLDIMAPGISVRTTFGTNGYGWFRGTSAACPNAAGVAALILSANDNLTSAEAKDILLSTANKDGNYSYNNNPAHPSSSWNNEMGHGVADAASAVLAALESASLFIQNRIYSVGAFSYLLNYEIRAGENVTNSIPNGDVEIRNNALVHFNAGKRILLKPGFQAQAGSDFRARIVSVACPTDL